MQKLVAWTMTLLLSLVVPVMTGMAKAETTITSSTSTSTSTSQTVTEDVYQNPEQDGEDGDTEKDDGEKDDGEKDGKDKGKSHEKKYKFKGKHKGIGKAIEALLKARNDGNGEASNAALDAVIEKLKEMLKQDGTAATDDEAEQAVEETIQSGIDNGTATDDEVEVLANLQITNKKVDQAKTDVETALERNPKSDKLYKLLSKVYQEKGDTKKVKVYVNGKEPAFDVQPYNKDGRNLVPVRAIAEALGAKVGWDQETQTVIIEKNGVTIELPLGSNEIRVNGQTKTIDSSAEITNNRTMVPVRFISEFLGQQVDWDAATNMVIVK